MKMWGMQIHGTEGAIRKLLKREWRVASDECREGEGPALSGRSARDTPTPVFLQKSLDLVDCEGVDFFRSDKESGTVSKRSVYVGNRRTDWRALELREMRNLLEVGQGKELAGLAGISWDIIPFG
jgi:hypothetical protein